MEDSAGKTTDGQFCFKAFKRTNKKILKGVSAYFTAGQLVGIMGPSGKCCTDGVLMNRIHK